MLENIFDVRVGPVVLDVPRSIGYFGGVGLAVSVGLIDPPLAVFIAAVPFWKVLTHQALPLVAQVMGAVLEGAARPVGGDAEGTVRLEDSRKDEAEAIDIARKAALGDRLRTNGTADQS